MRISRMIRASEPEATLPIPSSALSQQYVPEAEFRSNVRTQQCNSRPARRIAGTRAGETFQLRNFHTLSGTRRLRYLLRTNRRCSNYDFGELARRKSVLTGSYVISTISRTFRINPLNHAAPIHSITFGSPLCTVARRSFNIPPMRVELHCSFFSSSVLRSIEENRRNRKILSE